MRMGMRFTERMAGTWRTADGCREQPIGFDMHADVPAELHPLGSVSGHLAGTLAAGGLAQQAEATGTIELSPVEHRRIRYTIDFRSDDGTLLHLDGWKSIDWLRPVSTWTTLPATITASGGSVVGTATLRFRLRDLPAFAARMRATPWTDDVLALQEPRWKGRPGRLDVWYETFTDPVTGTGFWLHHELVAPSGPPRRPGAPSSGGDGAYLHGWAAAFPPDSPPTWARYGPHPLGLRQAPAAGAPRVEPGARSGEAGPLRWDLRFEDHSRPLHTVPAAAWRRELLPAAHVVFAPCATFHGTVVVGDRTVAVTDAPGAAARIYGHGNAERWAWLHADLGGGDVLEVVAAVPRRPGLRRLAPVTMVQLRQGGRDWPAHPLLAAPLMRCRIGLPGWTVSGRIGGRRLHVRVEQPAEHCVTVPCTDPDGSPATCTNTERANAHVLLERRQAGRWLCDGEWRLQGTAHAEVGSRP